MLGSFGRRHKRLGFQNIKYQYNEFNYQGTVAEVRTPEPLHAMYSVHIFIIETSLRE